MADNYCKCCGDGTPEYIIELNQQGAPGKRGEKGEQGYSPVVDFIADDNEIRFTSTNENNVTSTPNLYDYVLKKDGTNSANPITLNKTFIRDNNIYTSYNDLLLGNTDTNLYNLDIRYGTVYLKSYNPEIRNTSGDLTIQSEQNLYIRTLLGSKLSLNNSINIIGDTPYIGTQDPDNKIATIGDIPEVSNSKITISQGDVVKGSFTLNQSGDTTIELDTGITNPLRINSTDKSKRLDIGYTDDNRVYIRNNILGQGGGTYNEVALITPNITRAPMSLTAAPIDDLKGMYYITLNYDNDTLKVNGDKKLYADFTPINNSITTIEGNITELTTLADTTEASLNELKTDYEANKTEVAEELTTLGNQINTKVSKTELDELADTKNDNIFDIGKFTVVGSPTITDDGVASGIDASNFFRFNNPVQFGVGASIFLNFITGSTLNSANIIRFINGVNSKYAGKMWLGNSNILTLELSKDNSNSGTFIITTTLKVEPLTTYNIVLENSAEGLKIYHLGNLIGSSNTYSTVSSLQTGFVATSFVTYDLKQFSITVDGKEVFNGLMNSTKPIYDKITTTNTTLSTFQTDTDNNFSAVNSALNEKANLSDLANYVPLATYNALLARVEALETEINGGNA